MCRCDPLLPPLLPRALRPVAVLLVPPADRVRLRPVDRNRPGVRPIDTATVTQPVLLIDDQGKLIALLGRQLVLEPQRARPFHRRFQPGLLAVVDISALHGVVVVAVLGRLGEPFARAARRKGQRDVARRRQGIAHPHGGRQAVLRIVPVREAVAVIRHIPAVVVGVRNPVHRAVLIEAVARVGRGGVGIDHRRAVARRVVAERRVQGQVVVAVGVVHVRELVGPVIGVDVHPRAVGIGRQHRRAVAHVISASFPCANVRLHLRRKK